MALRASAFLCELLTVRALRASTLYCILQLLSCRLRSKVFFGNEGHKAAGKSVFLQEVVSGAHVTGLDERLLHTFNNSFRPTLRLNRPFVDTNIVIALATRIAHHSLLTIRV